MNANNAMNAPAKGVNVLNGPDAEILAAWERLKTARLDYESQPPSPLPHDDYTPRELSLIAVMDAAEIKIHAAKSVAPSGAEIKLWLALSHMIADKEAFSAAVREDCVWFDQRESEFDWIERLIFSAIRSLRAIGGAA